MKIEIRNIIVEMAMKSKKATENEQRVLNWITKDLEKMIEYYNHVYSMPQRIEMLRARSFDVAEFQEGVQKLDEQRMDKHDEAIRAIMDLDSCCKSCGFGSCVNADLEKTHRSDIADAIFAFCDKWVRKSANK